MSIRILQLVAFSKRQGIENLQILSKACIQHMINGPFVFLIMLKLKSSHAGLDLAVREGCLSLPLTKCPRLITVEILTCNRAFHTVLIVLALVLVR